MKENSLIQILVIAKLVISYAKPVKVMLIIVLYAWITLLLNLMILRKKI